ENIHGTQTCRAVVAVFRSFDQHLSVGHTLVPKPTGLETLPQPDWTPRGRPFAPLARPELPPRLSPPFLFLWPLFLVRSAVEGRQCVAQGREWSRHTAASVAEVAPGAGQIADRQRSNPQ